jgi:hypothetical protein
MNSIPLDWKDFLKYEIGIFAMALVASGVFLWTDGMSVATKLFLLFFLVPQPFVLNAFKDVLLSQFKKKEEIKAESHAPINRGRSEIDIPGLCQDEDQDQDSRGDTPK